MLALSGGVDSMCLAYLLAQYKAHVQPRMLVSAITIDHGFRKESATEAQKVGEIVRSWGLSHSVEKLQYSQDVHSISNFEEMARVLRYKVFREKCLDQGINALLVAHNRDDQLETFLQRLHMNSTMFGLLGLREKAPLPLMDSSADVEDKIHVYRPLLQFEKSSIRSTCEAHAVPWFEDVSNQDISLTKRNLLRYIINEYVPQSMASRPELACISRKSLFETTSEVEKLLNVYDTQKEILDQKIKSQGFFFDAMQAHMEFTIPLSDFDVLKQPVLARWLYEMIYPISSAKHFHWSYAKLERQAMPRLWAWLDAPDAILAMTYLNVSFRVQIEDTNVKFHISRQVPNDK
ncbi:hypothetical protein JCM33374_g1517 [Metschnikowia sp. JCM 33374]|nr:hypothetical protein JCM33374_g1517 [Metschnikowia sp. JCM 33374]